MMEIAETIMFNVFLGQKSKCIRVLDDRIICITEEVTCLTILTNTSAELKQRVLFYEIN